jgi:DNA-binding MarR family transcriptional regulator
MMDNQPETVHELNLLEQIEDDPDVTQASLALQLGVAVGTVNWYLKRLIAKGYVKVKRLQRRKLRYIITPEGIAFRARLTLNYIDTSMRLYRRTRQHVRELLGEVKQAGYHRVHIAGEGDIADICRLTCLEQGSLWLND